MLDLTFHAIEYAAYQPYMFNDPSSACAEREESKAKPGRFQNLPPASPRASLVQSFAAGVARLEAWVLTKIQGLKAALRPRAGVVVPVTQQSSSGYGRACEDSLRAFETIFRSNQPTLIHENLAYFCACHRGILDLRSSVGPTEATIFQTYLQRVKQLLGEDALKVLSSCQAGFHKCLNNNQLSVEARREINYRHELVSTLITFGASNPNH